MRKPALLWICSAICLLMLICGACAAYSQQDAGSTLLAGKRYVKPIMQSIEKAAPTVTGSYTLNDDYDKKHALISLYGNTVDENGSQISVTSPVIQWSGKNLAMDAYFIDDSEMYFPTVWADISLLEPGADYIISFEAVNNSAETTQITAGVFENSEQYISGSGRLEFPVRISSRLTKEDILTGMRKILLKNGQKIPAQIRNLQIEAAGANTGATAYEPFEGGSIVLTGVVLRSIGDICDELSLHEDGLFKITRRIEQKDSGLSVLKIPQLEVLDVRFQNQLASIAGKSGIVIEVISPNGVPCRFSAEAATPVGYRLMSARLKELHGGFVKVKNGLLYDERGREFGIKGINTGDSWGSSFSINAHSQSIYRQIAEFGFNTVRICLNYPKLEMYEPSSQGYVMSEYGLDELEKSVENASLQGVRAIIDMHVPQGGWNAKSEKRALFAKDSTDLQDRYVNMWAGIAQHFAGNDNVLGYGLCNEPVLMYMGSEENAVDYYTEVIQRTINEIRKYDTNHVIIVSLPLQYIAEDKSYWDSWHGAISITDPCDNLMLEAHQYFSGSVPYGNTIKPIAEIHQNVDNISEEWFDECEQVYEATNGGWQEISAGFSLTENSGGIDTASFVLSSQGLSKNENIYVNRIIVEKYPQDKPDKAEIILDITPADTDLIKAYDDFINFDSGNFSAVSLQKLWRFSVNITSSEIYAEIFKNLHLEPGYAYNVKINICSDTKNPQATARIKVCHINTTAKNAQPTHLFNTKEDLEYRLLYFKRAADQMGAALFIGETGYLEYNFNAYSNYEQWAKDMAGIVAKYNMQFSFHNTAGPELGLWRDYEAYVLHEERARLIKTYFLN